MRSPPVFRARAPAFILALAALLGTASCTTLAAPPAPAATDTSDPAEGFRAWVADFSKDALKAGISRATIDATLGKARWLAQVIELDGAQPEFVRPVWQYLDSAVSTQRIVAGKTLRQINAKVMDDAAGRYGVPTGIITAIWGVESNYGTHFGNFRTIDALATLAYDGRRREWARSELMAALTIVDKGYMPAGSLIGSWAGAMGHTQFLPSVYLKYAVDADGDGKRDIWGSTADVVASTANFLAQSGWRPSEPWGVEVRLPASFDYSHAELTVRQDSSAWAAEGVRTMDGRPLPAMRDASILTPAGERGPAVMVGNNFRVLLLYNSSTNYALAVSLLAQQIDGGPGLLASWPRQLKPLARADIQTMQTALNQLGMDAGDVDGVIGPATRAALRRFQAGQSLVADGYPTQELLQRLLQQQTKAAQP
ncbi:MAG: murein transglycosylase [Comamonas sp. SCN 67-35]|uniref:lytic murein transglycosylase n=1 Tax=unclassified Comamonas TaxID=2638500 RepID=UPI0008699939|nr:MULTISPECIES: lytic murein transglycosylase [unclassified Comamonas]MBN9331260.1 lytic murein transglycosylase [Comamonas sp.]ODU37552.1 MAG: murein transglycosylase [Comamonas sp. SCN 67-35]OJX02434.1 MAG: murein transglycosylase [Burkholderiales bacterium 66-26]